MPETIQIPHLSRLEMLELKSLDTTGTIAFRDEKPPTGAHGDMGTTTAVVIIGMATLKVIATWLAKRESRQTFKRTLRYIDPKGRKRDEVIEYSQALSDPPPAQILNALAALFHIDKTE